MQNHSGRLFTIACVIVLVLTRSSTNGFTIRKPFHFNLKNVPDLDTGESSLLEIRNDGPNTTITKAFDNNKSNEGINSTVIPLNDFNYTDIIIPESDKTIKRSKPMQNKPPDTKNLHESKKNATATFSTISSLPSKEPNIKQKVNDIQNNLINTSTISTTSAFGTSMTTKLDLRNKDFSSLNESLMTTEEEIYSTKLFPIEAVTDLSTTQQFLINATKNNNVTTTNNHDLTSTKSIYDEDKNNEAQASSKKTIYTTLDSLIERQLPSKIYTNVKHSEEFPLINTVSSWNTDSTDLSSESNYRTEPYVVLHQTFNKTNTGPSDIFRTKQSLRNDLKNFEGSTSIATEFKISQTNRKDLAEDQYATTILPFELYKIKEENKTSVVSNDVRTITKAIRAKSNIPQEKMLHTTTTRSTLYTGGKNVFANSLEHSTTSGLDRTNITIINRNSTENLLVLTTKVNTTKLPDKLDIFSSNRAGYLDNSETTTSKQQETTTEIFLKTVKVTNDSNQFGSIYESEVSDSDFGEVMGNRNTIAMESQSQLADDAIKEELLIEKTLNENEFLKSRHRNFNFNDSSTGNDVLSITELTEHTSNIIPIGSDKRRSTVLYTLSSKYKPPKKLEVQPTKPLVRDPDDNSWRNESISSLGIVFKAKNPARSFTEVLKNKTTELGNIVRNDYKNEVPELRLRLEKMTEVRKSKKKRINKFGDTMYSDYEESSENTNNFKEGITSSLVSSPESTSSSTTPLPPPSSTESSQIANAITHQKIEFFENDVTTTKVKSKKLYNTGEYYDTTDDYDADYATLPKLDIKKYPLAIKNKETITTPVPEIYFTPTSGEINTKAMTKTYQNDRQATVQYFPPTKKVTVGNYQTDNPKINANSFDSELKNNIYWYDGSSKTVHNTEPSARTKQFEESNKSTAKALQSHSLRPYDNLDRGIYLTSPPTSTALPTTFVPNDGSFNRASYIIKHYGGFIKEAAKSLDEERSSIFLPYTDSPIPGVTMNEVAKFNVRKESKPAIDYDYDAHFRRDVVNRFVDNFNQNSDRFKVDFPILYNSSVLHTNFQENGRGLASSNMFMKRLHDTREMKSNSKLCDVNCERMTVEISPSYELHYYVPDQEETEVMQPRANTYPYRFTL